MSIDEGTNPTIMISERLLGWRIIGYAQRPLIEPVQRIFARDLHFESGLFGADSKTHITGFLILGIFSIEDNPVMPL
jgi:hypothetical protein